jgi:hypothetical protein
MRCIAGILTPEPIPGSGLRSTIGVAWGRLNSCKGAQSISIQKRILLARNYLKNSSFLVPPALEIGPEM